MNALRQGGCLPVHYEIETWDQFLDGFMRHWPTADPHTYVNFVRNNNPRAGEPSELRLCE
jgi:hypothetical protein